MVNQFKKEPFMNRLKDTGFLLKNSFTVVGKDKDIIKPTIKMIIFSLLILIFIPLSVFLIYTGNFALFGIALLVFTLIIMVPWRFFYDVNQKATQGWIVYNTISGRDINCKDAYNHIKSEKGKLRLIAIVDIIIKYAKSQRGNRKGVLGIIIGLFLSFLAEVWDLLSHYMLPAVVIEQKSLKEIIPNIKRLANNVPATLMGVFGIDFVGNVVRTLAFPIYLFFILISIGIGALLSEVLWRTEITIGGLSFSWAPLAIIIYLLIIINMIIGKLVDSVKVIYFTIFYTSIMRPMEISEDMRDELTKYLLMDKSSFSEKSPSQAPLKKDKVEKEDPYIIKLADYFQNYINQGYSAEEIKDFLISKGYDKSDIDSALNYLMRNK